MVLNQLLVNQRDEHIRKHGPFLRVGDQYLSADGALLDSNDMIWSSDFEPPTDPRQLARRQQLYWQQRVDNAAQAVRNRKRQYLDEGLCCQKSGSPPPDEKAAVAELTKLRKELEACQEELGAVEYRMKRLNPHAERQQKDRDANRAAASSLLEAVSRFEV